MSEVAETEVLQAAHRRAAALVACDADALRDLMHPLLQWTTLRGEVLSCDEYIAGNTSGALRWRAQRLEDVRVTVVRDTAVLTALVTDEVSRGEEDLTFTLCLTQTWVRGAAGWQCLSGHAGPTSP